MTNQTGPETAVSMPVPAERALCTVTYNHDVPCGAEGTEDIFPEYIDDINASWLVPGYQLTTDPNTGEARMCLDHMELTAEI